MAAIAEVEKSSRQRSPTFLHFAFLAAIVIKGVDGVIEAVVGLVIWFAGSWPIYRFVVRITAPDLAETAEGHAAHLLQHGASTLAHASHPFVVTYLLIHGFLKLAIAISLLLGKAWIFPIASAVLVGFILYMGFRLTTHWSGWLLGFALFDALTLLLVLNEWRNGRHAAP
jgi:uncharacterized membrane protein